MDSEALLSAATHAASRAAGVACSACAQLGARLRRLAAGPGGTPAQLARAERIAVALFEAEEAQAGQAWVPQVLGLRFGAGDGLRAAPQGPTRGGAGAESFANNNAAPRRSNNHATIHAPRGARKEPPSSQSSRTQSSRTPPAAQKERSDALISPKVASKAHRKYRSPLSTNRPNHAEGRRDPSRSKAAAAAAAAADPWDEAAAGWGDEPLMLSPRLVR